jgi:hypothetical protein
MEDKLENLKNRPLLSIIFPNRGHFDYAQETIRNILEIEDSRFELIINDNSSPEMFDYSPFLSDKRVSLYVEENVLSMNKNWWNGLSRARGKWVTFIGAEDGVVSQNFPEFLNNLEVMESEVVTTRQSVFSYSLNQRPPQLQIPSNRPKRDSKVISYPYRRAAFFPQLRNTVLPIPYNGSVVKREILTDVLNNSSQIPGIAPDDYLGQYVAQYCKDGLFLDLLVFIQGTSERSNGVQIHQKISSFNSAEFISDSRTSMGRLTKRFGLDCIAAVALEHYSIVWEEFNRKQNPLRLTFLTYWCSLTCHDKGHSHGSAPKYLAWLLTTFVNISVSIIRKSWLLRNFGLDIPFRSISIKLPPDSTVRSASRILAKH